MRQLNLWPYLPPRSLWVVLWVHLVELEGGVVVVLLLLRGPLVHHGWADPGVQGGGRGAGGDLGVGDSDSCLTGEQGVDTSIQNCGTPFCNFVSIYKVWGHSDSDSDSDSDSGDSDSDSFSNSDRGIAATIIGVLLPLI